MLAPIDKIRKPNGNDILQIAITRKCDLFSCSNCTQGLPFRKDAVEMSLACMEKALLSLRGWPGVIAMFGGNPCSHSKFEEACRLWRELVPNQKQRGLWTNNLMGHGQVVRDTFWPEGRFNLNVHGDMSAMQEMEQWLPGIKIWGETRSLHGMLLAHYGDYGISESEWIALREQCDINQNWSGLVREYGGEPVGYFCEVAATLDGIRGENHGVACVAGWWQQEMSFFQEQVARCCDRGCGVPLRGIGSFDDEKVYDVSRAWSGELRRANSVTVTVREERPTASRELTDYIGLRE